MRSDWHQRWRGPLRGALDWLRDQLDPFFEARASAYLKDPWEARDRYVEVLLDGRADRFEEFFARHRRVPLDPAARVETRRLLELQRNRLLMYTSCGWFFDEISSLEPVQILRYAAMAIQYLRDLGGGQLEGEFVRRLESAPSNVPEFRDGGDVYRRLIKPAVIELRRVVAHYAISGLFEPYDDEARVYAYRVTRLDEAREAYDGTALRIAHVRVSSEITGDTREVMSALLHFGGHDFSCGIRAYEDDVSYGTMKADLLRRYARYSLADIVRGMDEHFPGKSFSLTDLFLEERRRVIASVIRTVLDKYEETYRRIWEENRKLVRYLRQVDAPIPDGLAIVARHVLERDILAELEAAAALGAVPTRAFELADEARALGLTLDLEPARAAMDRVVRHTFAAVNGSPTPEAIVNALTLIEDANRTGVWFGLWAAQNQFFELWRRHAEARSALVPLATALGFSLPLEREA